MFILLLPMSLGFGGKTPCTKTSCGYYGANAQMATSPCTLSGWPKGQIKGKLKEKPTSYDESLELLI